MPKECPYELSGSRSTSDGLCVPMLKCYHSNAEKGVYCEKV